MTWFKTLQLSKVSLLGIGAGLISIHLAILEQTRNPNFWGMSLLFWIGITALLWEKRRQLDLNSDGLSCTFGTILIGSVLLKSNSSIDPEPYISPLMMGFGLGCIASGFKGIFQYWQEFILLVFLEVAQTQMFWLVDISPLTAKFSAALLWYLGFSVQLQGVQIYLPNGAVEVNAGCSGLEGIFHMLGIALLLLMHLPIKTNIKLYVPIVGILLGFIINGIRVALMAILSASSQADFDYWHTGSGSLIFSMVPVILIAIFYFFLIRIDSPMLNLPAE